MAEQRMSKPVRLRLKTSKSATAPTASSLGSLGLANPEYLSHPKAFILPILLATHHVTTCIGAGTQRTIGVKASSSLTTSSLSRLVAWKPFLQGSLSGPAVCEGLKEDSMFEVILRHLCAYLF
ncbi:TPA: hypothetical protein ACH3X3_007350 [Trebouxia sp. C0006]